MPDIYVLAPTAWQISNIKSDSQQRLSRIKAASEKQVADTERNGQEQSEQLLQQIEQLKTQQQTQLETAMIS